MRQRVAFRPDNLRLGVHPGGGDPGPGTDPGGFIPAGAQWWFSRQNVTDGMRQSWNAQAAANSGPPNQVRTDIDLRPGGMPGYLQLNQLCVQPRCAGPLSPHAGAIRIVRKKVGPFADATGGGPNDSLDKGGDWTPPPQPAHTHCVPLSASKVKLGPAYGQRCEYGFKFFVPTKPTSLEGDGLSNCLWAVIGSLATSANNTTEFIGIYLLWYGLGQRMWPMTAVMKQDKTEIMYFHPPSGGPLIRTDPPTAGPSWSPRMLTAADGRPWSYNTWHTVRMVFMPAGWDDARGWADFYLDDMAVPFARARGIPMGKQGDTKTETLRVGTYWDYDVGDKHWLTYIDQAYLVLGPTGFPGPPS